MRLADGWLGNAFIPEAAEVFLGPLREGAARAGRDAGGPRSRCARRGRDPRRRARPPTPPHAATPTGTRSPSVRWARAAATSTTTLSPGWATAMKSLASPSCGRAGKRDEARQAVPIDLGRLTNLVGTPDENRRAGGQVSSGRDHDAAGQTGGRLRTPAGDARAAARHHRRWTSSVWADVPMKPSPIEDLRGGDADAVGPDGPTGAQARSRCPTAPDAGARRCRCS